jgi:L-ribulose-5-phosphate 3-epimerase UlaE
VIRNQCTRADLLQSAEHSGFSRLGMSANDLDETEHKGTNLGWSKEMPAVWP